MGFNSVLSACSSRDKSKGGYSWCLGHLPGRQSGNSVDKSEKNISPLVVQQCTLL